MLLDTIYRINKCMGKDVFDLRVENGAQKKREMEKFEKCKPHEFKKTSEPGLKIHIFKPSQSRNHMHSKHKKTIAF